MQKLNLILLIDDNDGDNEFNTIVVERTNIAERLECIPSSRKALEYLTKSFTEHDNSQFPTPDLVFLDINMPAMNGFEFLDRLRNVPDPFERKQNMKIFMLTGSLNPDDYKLATEKYNDLIKGFRIKPMLDSVFTEIVRYYFLP